MELRLREDKGASPDDLTGLEKQTAALQAKKSKLLQEISQLEMKKQNNSPLELAQAKPLSTLTV